MLAHNVMHTHQTAAAACPQNAGTCELDFLY
jgi:hypothetical protein